MLEAVIVAASLEATLAISIAALVVTDASAVPVTPVVELPLQAISDAQTNTAAAAAGFRVVMDLPG